MNERLTELYRSCRNKEALASQDEYKSANVLLGSEVEKFAELLVRECAKISKETCNELKADETIQMPALKTSLNLYHATLRNKLDEHFGVEL